MLSLFWLIYNLNPGGSGGGGCDVVSSLNVSPSGNSMTDSSLNLPSLHARSRNADPPRILKHPHEHSTQSDTLSDSTTSSQFKHFALFFL
jgi:hypothetical protein